MNEWCYTFLISINFIQFQCLDLFQTSNLYYTFKVRRGKNHNSEVIKYFIFFYYIKCEYTYELCSSGEINVVT